MSEVFVRVAVRVRPLLPREVLHNHRVCVRKVPGSAQVMLGSERLFSFDHAFGPTDGLDEVYGPCVRPLLGSLVDGHNATVFCYGQTGSGKTYTLRGGSLDKMGGIIDRVAQDVFLLLGEKRKNGEVVDATVRVSYIELYREELRDLLELHTVHKELHIREDEKGNTVVVGAKEVAVTSAEELLSVLETGNALRHTGTTGMNEHSSRSHAILALQLVQCCHKNNSSLKSVHSSKLCLVDLAGSERAGKTGNTGTRLKESVHINTGLLALGNVIRALSDPARNRSAHIPYRDAKITRLLRDSLGGTAHTLMVACVSPSHHSVAETLSVLQFASKARHICNRPGAISTHTEVKSCPKPWDPGEARVGELEYEVHTLRELLKEKEREMEMQRTGGGAGEGESFKESSQIKISEPDQKMNQKEASRYLLLAQEAAALLADTSGPSPSHSFKQRLQDWQERLTAVKNTHQISDQGCSEGNGGQPDHVTILKLREELNKCQEALYVEEQLLEQKDAELKQVKEDVEKLLQERKTHLQALEEEKKHNCIKTEQLVDQRILIDRLRTDLMTFQGAATGVAVEAVASGNSSERPHTVPLIRHSCGNRPPREIHSSPPTYSLERVLAAFKMRGHLLLAELEEKDEVYCPFIKQQAESKHEAQEKEEEDEQCVSKMAFRRSLYATWTRRQQKSALKEKNTGLDQTSNRNPLLQQPQQATDKDVQPVDKYGRHTGDGREAGMLARLSMQSQQLRDSSWLEQEEEQVLQERAELQELEEELRRREEVLQHREACLHQKNQLEIKMLRCSEALSQDLLRVSIRLESVEKHLQGSRNARCTPGVTTEELERERDMLKKRRDALDSQLKENRVLTVEDEHSLLQLEEAIEALDAALEFKNSFIQDKQKRLLITDSSSDQSQSTEPTQLCDIISKLKELSTPEALELLIKYFNKVVCLREAERHLRLRCEELELNAGEQEAMLREMEAAMQHLALDADRRLNKLHQDHQKNIQLLLQKLQEAGSEDPQQDIQNRMQHLEKELFFYKSSTRELKKKLRELFSGAPHPDDQPPHKQEHRQKHDVQIHESKNKSQTHTEEVITRTGIAMTYTKIHAEQTNQKTKSDSHVRRHAHRTPCPSSSSDLQAHNKTKMPEYNQTHTRTLSQGRNDRGLGECEEALEVTSVRLCHRELRQFSPADLQLSGCATRGRQSAVDTSTESILEDSIEVPRNTDR